MTYQLPEECFSLHKEAAYRAPKMKANPVRPRPTPKPTIGGVASGIASRIPKPLLYGGIGGGGLYGLGQYLSGLVSDAQNRNAPTPAGSADEMAQQLEARKQRLQLGQ